VDHKPLKKPAVICYAGDDYWHSNPHSRYHFMHALHRRGYKVLWVNSLGMNMPKVLRKGFARKVLQRIKSWTRWLKPANQDFFVLTPIALPLFGNPVLARMTDIWIKWQIQLAMKIAKIEKPLVFASIPSYATIIRELPKSSLIYYYSDKYVAHDDITAATAIEARDKELFETADTVFCASAMITEELHDKRADVHYLPHAVDVPHFSSALDGPSCPPDDISCIPSPRIGYYGSLAHNNDLEMIHHAATENPSLQFVLIGKVFGDYSLIQGLPNVHMLGFKPYADIPRYGRYFDVAFMNWKMTEWIRNCSPLKAKEYLSMGLPVVSIPIKELEQHYSDLIYFAATPAEFLTQVEKALEEDNEHSRQLRRDRVRHESWDHRVTEMLDYLAQAKQKQTTLDSESSCQK